MSVFKLQETVVRTALLFVAIVALFTASLTGVVSADRPYFKVYGGDVAVGSGFNNGAVSCDTNQNASLFGYNSDSGDYTGSGSQLAAMVFGQIDQFATGQISQPTSPKSLSFANVAPSNNGYGSSSYGGGLFADGNAVCARDYFADAPANADVSAASISVHNLSEGVHRRNGDLLIAGGDLYGSVEGSRTLYVDGNVRITGPIGYGPDPAPVYQDVAEIPSFRLIVRGNIYVNPGGDRLDGVYIAQPRLNGSGNPIGGTGRFYTCGINFAAPSNAQMINECRAAGAFRLFGAVVAQQVKLTRSRGDVGTANVNQRFDHFDDSNGALAESFTLTPEVWLTGGFGDEGYNAVTALPPIL